MFIIKPSIPLEAAAQEVCRQSAIPPFIYQQPPAQGRRVLEEAQNAPVYKYPANILACRIDTQKWGTIPLYFIAPTTIRNIIFYIHGAGWVFGSFHTHEKLVRELAARTNSLVVFPEYSRAPEARFPAAIEQCYFILSHLQEIFRECAPSCDCHTLTVAGDSVGGNMAIAMALLSAQRCGPSIDKLLLYYPVTNACFQTPSYLEFCRGYYLTRAGMQWFWQQYLPCLPMRQNILSPAG